VFAAVLLAAPEPYAALACAWIDRAWGVPLTEPRLAWLRDLGVRDDALLDELAVPIAPMPGLRFYADVAPEDREHVARAAETCGLPMLAMPLWTALRRPDDHLRAGAATEALLARLHAAAI
jgi:hypothetical protein